MERKKGDSQAREGGDEQATAAGRIPTGDRGGEAGVATARHRDDRENQRQLHVLLLQYALCGGGGAQDTREPSMYFLSPRNTLREGML